MDTDLFIEKVRDLIAHSKLNEAIDLLKGLLKHSPKLNEVILQSSRLANIKEVSNLGLVDFGQTSLTTNEVTFALLVLVDEIEEQRNNPVIEADITQALKNDLDKLNTARGILIKWRGQFAVRKSRLKEFIQKLKQWEETPADYLNDEILAVFEFAKEVATAFDEIDIFKLKFTEAYGLYIHKTVYDGICTSEAYHCAKIYSTESRSNAEKINELRQNMGLKPVYNIPGSYTYELLGRLLSAAENMLNFDLDRLSKGYLEAVPLAQIHELGKLEKIFVLKIHENPRLILASIDEKFKMVSFFSGRKLGIYPYDAIKRSNGQIDVLGKDANHIYYWKETGLYPELDFFKPETILYLFLLTQNDDSSQPVIIDYEGNVMALNKEGGTNLLGKIQKDTRSATLWQDEFNKQEWKIFSLDNKMNFYVLYKGLNTLVYPSNELWESNFQTPEGIEYEKKMKEISQVNPDLLSTVSSSFFSWINYSNINLTKLDGFDCLMFFRSSSKGAGIYFLDPYYLGHLRERMYFSGSVSDFLLVNSKWLVVLYFQESVNSTKNKIEVWDIGSDTPYLLNKDFPQQGDVHSPILMNFNESGFEMLFIFGSFTGNNERYLYKYTWPDNKVEELHKSIDIKIQSIRGSKR